MRRKSMGFGEMTIVAIIALLIAAACYAVLAVLVNLAVAFLFDYELGFWKTLIGLWLLAVIGNRFKSSGGGNNK